MSANNNGKVQAVVDRDRGNNGKSNVVDISFEELILNPDDNDDISSYDSDSVLEDGYDVVITDFESKM